MELGQKIKDLRREHGLTQEQLAAALYVSRTAVSKWESGKGVPNVDSLQALARYFSVPVDNLLSGEALLGAARRDRRRLCDRIAGLLNVASALLLFLPLFGQAEGEGIAAVSLLALSGVAPYVRGIGSGLIAAHVLLGLVWLFLPDDLSPRLLRFLTPLPLALGALTAVAFILFRQPYAAILMLFFLSLQVFLTLRRP